MKAKLPRVDTMEFEIIRLLGFTLVSVLVISQTGYTPRLRLSWEMMITGLCVGVAIAAILMIARNISAKKFHSRYHLVASAVVAAAGSELLLRGCIFGWLLIREERPMTAYLVNLALSGLSGTRWKPTLAKIVLEGVKGTLLAMLFHHTKSLTAVAVARGALELSLGFLSVVNIFPLRLRGRAGGTKRSKIS